MKKNCSIIPAILFMSLTSVSVRANVPSGFEDLFSWETKQVVLRSLDGKEWGRLSLDVQYNKFRLSPGSEQELKRFVDFLEYNKVNRKFIENTVKALTFEIENDSNCIGRVATCAVIPENISFFYDYDTNLLYLYANANALDTEVALKEYASSYNDSNILINNLALYGSNYQDRNNSLTISDKAVLGLPYGYAKMDYELTYREDDQDNDSRLYEGSYNFNYQGVGFSVGRFSRTPIANATDFLQPKSNINEYAASIFSSDNLRSNKIESRQRLHYYSPASGELRVYQGDRVVYRQNIQAGQGYVSYNNLPYGRNELKLEIINFGKVVSSDLVTVANFSNDGLASGEWDFYLSGGTLESKFSYEHNDNIDWESLGFAKSLFAYKASDFLTLAFGGLYTDEASYGSVGVKASLPFNVRADFINEFYSDGGGYFSGGLSMPQLSIRYENFQVGDTRLSSYMHDFYDFYQITANGYVYFPWGHSGYLSFSKGQRSFNFIGEAPIINNKVDYWNASLGYRANLGKLSTLELNLDYQGDSDDTIFSMQLTIPFGDGAQVQSSAYWRGGLDQVRNSASIQRQIGDNANYNMNVAHTYYDGQGPGGMLDATASYNYSNAYMHSGINGYVDSWGERGLTANFSSTQIVTSDSVRLTKDKSDSYLLMDIEAKEEVDSYGLLSITRDNRPNNKLFIEDKQQVIPINSFRNYSIDFNSEAVSLFSAENESFSDFSLPGKATVIKRKVARTVSFLAQFVDILNRPLSGIECVGLACNKMQELNAGIYQVSVLNGDLFQLKQRDLICYIPEQKILSGSYNFGRNYCLPDIDVGESTLVQSEQGEMKEFIFLGTYVDHDMLHKHMDRVLSLGGKVISTDIDSSTLLFVEKSDNFAANPKAKELIEHMSAMQKKFTNSVYSITQR